MGIKGGLIPILRMGASRHQIPHRLLVHDPVLRVLLKVVLTLPLRVVGTDSVRKQGILP